MELTQLIGEDPAFEPVKQRVPLLARVDAPVLLAGETGTGKELCARAIHYLSRRAGKPFLPVNCGAIPTELFESEMFGHQKGAFTGAWTARPGFIAEAEGGTLFLDEVDTLSLGAQAKLLRVLEGRSYCVLGSSRPREADVRIVSATNVDLLGKVREGVFRADLFYRLAVMSLALPPLRERPTDIPRLAEYFWARYMAQHDGPPKRLSSAALEALCHHAWPGNVRELANVIQHVIAVTDGRPVVDVGDLPIAPAAQPPSNGASFRQIKAQVVRQFERTYLTDLLRAHQGNVTQAARAARTGRRALGRLIKKHQLEKRQLA